MISRIYTGEGIAHDKHIYLDNIQSPNIFLKIDENCAEHLQH